MRSLILGLSVAALALPAAAQVQRCGMEFGKWVCRTELPRPQPNIYQSGMEAYARTTATLAEGQRQREAADAARQQYAQPTPSLQQDVADAVRRGDCAGAKELALRGGNLDLAEQAGRLCAN